MGVSAVGDFSCHLWLRDDRDRDYEQILAVTYDGGASNLRGSHGEVSATAGGEAFQPHSWWGQEARFPIYDDDVGSRHERGPAPALIFLGGSAADMSVVGLTPMPPAKLKPWWGLLVKRGLSALTPDTLKSACTYMDQFMLHCPADPALTVVLGPDVASSHFWDKAPMAKPVSRTGLDGVDLWSDEEKAKRDADWRLVMVMHEIRLSQLCDIGSTLEVAVDISDLWGVFSSVTSVTDTTKLFHRVSDVLFFVTEARKKH